MKSQRKRSLIVVGAFAIALVTISVPRVFGSHQFTDVPSSSPQHSHISAIANARITAGCDNSPPRYCPGSAVTRGQMAVFLSKVGGLDLGPGGVPSTVVDALTDQGVLVLRFFDTNPAFLTSPGSSGCVEVDLPFEAPFGQYSIKHQLYNVEESGGDPAMETAEINVALRDDAADGYQICVATTDGGPLSRGVYKMFGTMTVDLGQGLFRTKAGAAKARDAAARIRDAAS